MTNVSKVCSTNASACRFKLLLFSPAPFLLIFSTEILKYDRWSLPESKKKIFHSLGPDPLRFDRDDAMQRSLHFLEKQVKGESAACIFSTENNIFSLFGKGGGGSYKKGKRNYFRHSLNSDFLAKSRSADPS